MKRFIFAIIIMQMLSIVLHSQFNNNRFNPSKFSKSSDSSYVLSKPTGLELTLGEYMLTLNWNNNGTYDSLRIYKNGALLETIESATSYLDSPVTYAEHCYYLVADSAGTLSGASNVACNFPNLYNTIHPPTGLIATADTFKVDLNWTNNGTYDYIRIRRNGSYIDTIALTTSYTDTPLVPNTSYTYALLADSAGILSTISGTANATTIDTATNPVEQASSDGYFVRSDWTIDGDNYYFDSVGGNDGNTGTSKGQAWQSLSQLDNKTFTESLRPGDTLFFKRGSSWLGYNELETDTASAEGIFGSDDGFVVFTYYGSQSDALPYIEFLRIKSNIQKAKFEKLKFEGVLLYGKSYSAPGSNYDRPTYDNQMLTGSNDNYFQGINISSLWTVHDVWFDSLVIENDFDSYNFIRPSRIPLNNLERDDVGRISKVEINNTTFEYRITGGDRLNLGDIGDSLWFHNNTILGAAQEWLDLGGGNDHIVENNYCIDANGNGIKLHSQGAPIKNAVVRGNILIDANAYYPLALENVDSAIVHNNTIIDDGYNLAHWNRDRLRYLGYYGNSIHWKVLNNIFTGPMHIAGGWSTVTDWDTIYVQSGIAPSASFVATPITPQDVVYTPIGVGSGDTLHAYNDYNYNTYNISSSTKARYLWNDGYDASSNLRDATWDRYDTDITNINTWMDSRTGEVSRDPLFTDNTYTNYLDPGDYTLQSGSSERNTGDTIPAPSFVNYKWYQDYFGNYVDPYTPDRGAIQYGDYTPVVDTTTPDAPTGLNLALHADSNRINITWTDNSDNETGFPIYAGTSLESMTLQKTAGVDAESSYLSGLLYDTLYYVRVHAKNTNATPDISSGITDSITTGEETEDPPPVAGGTDSLLFYFDKDSTGLAYTTGGLDASGNVDSILSITGDYKGKQFLSAGVPDWSSANGMNFSTPEMLELSLNNSATPFDSGGISISIVISDDTGIQGRHVISSTRFKTDSTRWALYVDKFYVSEDGGTSVVTADPNQAASGVSHLYADWGEGYAPRMFIKHSTGDYTDTAGTVVNDLVTSEVPITLGMRATQSFGYDGKIYYIKIWDKRLSDSDRQAEINAVNTRFSIN
jgi:hypothetical protein